MGHGAWSVAILLLATGAAHPNGYALLHAAAVEASAVHHAGSVSADTLRLSVEVPRRVPTGDPVPLTLRVKNVSDGPLDLHLRGRTIAFDLIVTGPDGKVVWRRLADELIPAILRIETLGLEESLHLSDTWDQRSGAGEQVPTGHYTVRGEVLTEGAPLVTSEEPLHVDP